MLFFPCFLSVASHTSEFTMSEWMQVLLDLEEMLAVVYRFYPAYVRATITSLWDIWFLQSIWYIEQTLTFVSVHENQISLKLLHLLFNSMSEIDSHIWMLRESLQEMIVILFESKVLLKSTYCVPFICMRQMDTTDFWISAYLLEKNNPSSYTPSKYNFFFLSAWFEVF